MNQETFTFIREFTTNLTLKLCFQKDYNSMVECGTNSLHCYEPQRFTLPRCLSRATFRLIHFTFLYFILPGMGTRTSSYRRKWATEHSSIGLPHAFLYLLSAIFILAHCTLPRFWATTDRAKNTYKRLERNTVFRSTCGILVAYNWIGSPFLLFWDNTKRFALRSFLAKEWIRNSWNGTR